MRLDVPLSEVEALHRLLCRLGVSDGAGAPVARAVRAIRSVSVELDDAVVRTVRSVVEGTLSTGQVDGASAAELASLLERLPPAPTIAVVPRQKPKKE